MADAFFVVGLICLAGADLAAVFPALRKAHVGLFSGGALTAVRGRRRCGPVNGRGRGARRTGSTHGGRRAPGRGCTAPRCRTRRAEMSRQTCSPAASASEPTPVACPPALPSQRGMSSIRPPQQLSRLAVFGQCGSVLASVGSRHGRSLNRPPRSGKSWSRTERTPQPVPLKPEWDRLKKQLPTTEPGGRPLGVGRVESTPVAVEWSRLCRRAR
jgi:hypothetical protein